MIRPPPRSTLFPYTNALPISTRLRKPRRRRGEGRNNVGDSGGVGVSLAGPRKRRVGRLASSSRPKSARAYDVMRSEEHTSELQSQSNIVCRLLLEKKNQHRYY